MSFAVMVGAIVVILVFEQIAEHRVESEAWIESKVYAQQVKRLRIRERTRLRAQYAEIGAYPVKRRWWQC